VEASGQFSKLSELKQRLAAKQIFSGVKCDASFKAFS